MEKYKIQKVEPSPYNPQSSQVESLNKILKQIVRKIVVDNQKDCHDRLPKTLWSYQIFV